MHVILVMTAFIFGSLAMLTSFTILRDSTIKYVLVVLGAIPILDIILVIIYRKQTLSWHLALAGQKD